jgi:hypothetical protein
MDLRHQTEEGNGLKLYKDEGLSAVRGIGTLVMYERISKKRARGVIPYIRRVWCLKSKV